MHRARYTALLLILGVVFIVEGFLVAGLVTRQSSESFLASVVSAL